MDRQSYAQEQQGRRSHASQDASDSDSTIRRTPSLTDIEREFNEYIERDLNQSIEVAVGIFNARAQPRRPEINRQPSVTSQTAVLGYAGDSRGHDVVERAAPSGQRSRGVMSREDDWPLTSDPNTVPGLSRSGAHRRGASSDQSRHQLGYDPTPRHQRHRSHHSPPISAPPCSTGRTPGSTSQPSGRAPDSYPRTQINPTRQPPDSRSRAHTNDYDTDRRQQRAGPSAPNYPPPSVPSSGYPTRDPTQTPSAPSHRRPTAERPRHGTGSHPPVSYSPPTGGKSLTPLPLYSHQSQSPNPFSNPLMPAPLALASRPSGSSRPRASVGTRLVPPPLLRHRPTLSPSLSPNLYPDIPAPPPTLQSRPSGLSRPRAPVEAPPIPSTRSHSRPGPGPSPLPNTSAPPVPPPPTRSHHRPGPSPSLFPNTPATTVPTPPPPPPPLSQSRPPVRPHPLAGSGSGGVRGSGGSELSTRPDPVLEEIRRSARPQQQRIEAMPHAGGQWADRSGRGRRLWE